MLSDSHLSVANLGGDSKPRFRKEKYTFYRWCGGTLFRARLAVGPHQTSNIHFLLLAGTLFHASWP